MKYTHRWCYFLAVQSEKSLDTDYSKLAYRTDIKERLVFQYQHPTKDPRYMLTQNISKKSNLFPKSKTQVRLRRLISYGSPKLRRACIMDIQFNYWFKKTNPSAASFFKDHYKCGWKWILYVRSCLSKIYQRYCC